MIRSLFFLPVAFVCLAAAPATLARRPVVGSKVSSNAIPSTSEFESLVSTNPVAALEASLAKQQRDVRGYTCVLQKQERLGGKLGEVEIIRHAVREEPFATTLVWTQGGGAAKAILYVKGENAGRMKVKSKYLITTNTDPNGVLAKGSSRYSIEDAGIRHSTQRTIAAWKEDPQLHVEFLGRQPVKELGRECYMIRRLIPNGDADPFRSGDAKPTNPEDVFTRVTLYLDCETWLQVGSVLERADGSLLGAYWFKDVIINSLFDPKQFTPAILN